MGTRPACRFNLFRFAFLRVGGAGLEPAASALWEQRSTAELIALVAHCGPIASGTAPVPGTCGRLRFVTGGLLREVCRLGASLPIRTGILLIRSQVQYPFMLETLDEALSSSIRSDSQNTSWAVLGSNQLPLLRQRSALPMS
jgi:hypothetical protein